MNAHVAYIVTAEGRPDPVGFAWKDDADDFARAIDSASVAVYPVAIHGREQAAELIEEVSK